MSDDSSRREFLRWMGLGGSIAAASGLVAGCADPRGGPRSDAAPTDAGSPEDTVSDTGIDAAGDANPADVAADTQGPPDSSQPDTRADAGDTADASPDADDSCRVTGSDVEGPFHADGAPNRTELAPDDEPGEPILIEGTVYGPDCTTPLSQALLDVWHANKDGDYYDAGQNYRLRGQMMADDQGRYAFRSIKPGNYPLGGTTRPAHIHFNVSAPGHEPLTTQLYFKSDPHLAPNDPCTGCNSGDPTLIIELNETRISGETVLRGTFDIVLPKATT